MVNENDLLEPRKAFLETLQDEHHKNASAFFDELTKKSQIDVAANAATMSLLNKYSADAQKVRTLIHKKKVQRGWLIALLVLSILATIVFAYLIFSKFNDDYLALFISLLVVFPILFVLSIILIAKKINPVIKNNAAILGRLENEIKNQKAIGMTQMAPLNALYDWNMHTKLIHQTIPLFEMDDNFNIERFQYLVDKFGFGNDDDTKHSTIFVQSGAILGNPFVIETARVEQMGTCQYSGSITITYTVRVPTGSGGYTTQTRSQTLTATVTKPKPYYHYEKWLHYGCEAAPHLSFSREPVGADKMNEKDFEKFVKAKDETLNKMSQKNIKNGFTPLANSEFEALFNAMNRNNEMEFRLLFTPLAQTNFMELLREKEPYGDDFTFIKRKMLNSVSTLHSQTVDYECDPRSFIDYSYENARNHFLRFNDTYFQSFFFDIAPIISIPLYQQYPTDEYIFKKKWDGNITSYESESMANAFGDNYFAHQDAATPSILKSQFVKEEGNADRINIHAYAYRTEERIDYVRLLGNDGSWHTVPVHWLEYLPVYAKSQIEIQKQKSSRQQFNDLQNSDQFKQFQSDHTFDGKVVYQRNLFSFCPKSEEEDYDPQTLCNVFKDENDKVEDKETEKEN